MKSQQLTNNKQSGGVVRTPHNTHPDMKTNLILFCALVVFMYNTASGSTPNLIVTIALCLCFIYAVVRTFADIAEEERKH